MVNLTDTAILVVSEFLEECVKNGKIATGATQLHGIFTRGISKAAVAHITERILQDPKILEQAFHFLTAEA